MSRHYVTQLKDAYLQLKWMLCSGCTFVGHGLKKVLHARSPLLRSLSGSLRSHSGTHKASRPP